jgi:anti-anti-sigma factor
MLHTCESEGAQVVKFEGCIDTARCAEIEADLRTSLAQSTSAIVFDLAGVDFICSAFLRLCIYGRQIAADRGFQIANASPPVRLVFKIAGLDGLLNVR